MSVLCETVSKEVKLTAYSRPIAAHIAPFFTNIGHSSQNSELIVGKQLTSIERFHYIPYIDVEGFPLKPLKDNYHGS